MKTQRPSACVVVQQSDTWRENITTIEQTNIPFTQQAKQMLTAAWDESRRLGHNYVNIEHLFLSIFRDPNSISSKLLEELGITAKIELRMDASAAIGIISRRGIGKTRHIAVSELWMQDMVSRRGSNIDQSQRNGQSG